MAGLVRSHDVAPPRANWGFRNSAPEWRWFWRQCAGLWRFDYPDTAYNIATRDGGDAGGGHVGWDGASVATTPFGRGAAAGGGMAVTSLDPGFWHDAIAERTGSASASSPARRPAVSTFSAKALSQVASNWSIRPLWTGCVARSGPAQ